MGIYRLNNPILNILDNEIQYERMAKEGLFIDSRNFMFSEFKEGQRKQLTYKIIPEFEKREKDAKSLREKYLELGMTPLEHNQKKYYIMYTDKPDIDFSELDEFQRDFLETLKEGNKKSVISGLVTTVVTLGSAYLLSRNSLNMEYPSDSGSGRLNILIFTVAVQATFLLETFLNNRSINMQLENFHDYDNERLFGSIGRIIRVLIIPIIAFYSYQIYKLW